MPYKNSRSCKGQTAKSFFSKVLSGDHVPFDVRGYPALLSQFFTLNLLNILTSKRYYCHFVLWHAVCYRHWRHRSFRSSFLALSVCPTRAGLLNQNYPIAAALFIRGASYGGRRRHCRRPDCLRQNRTFYRYFGHATGGAGIAYIYQVGSVAVINNQTFLTNFAGNLGPIPIAIIYAVIIGKSSCTSC